MARERREQRAHVVVRAIHGAGEREHHVMGEVEVTEGHGVRIPERTL